MNTIRMSNSLDPDQARRIWVQTVCHGYQQTILVDKELKIPVCFISKGFVNYPFVSLSARCRKKKMVLNSVPILLSWEFIYLCFNFVRPNKVVNIAFCFDYQILNILFCLFYAVFYITVHCNSFVLFNCQP